MTDTLFDMPAENPKHPAKYTDALLTTFVRMLRGCTRILDPFGGTGKVFLINRWLPNVEIQAVEIEPEWAAINSRMTLGNALCLPWGDGYFDAVCTSPTYGNEMCIESDKSKWSQDWITFRYADMVGHTLHEDNSGKLKWGKEYREFHMKAWMEARRVLSPGGKFVLNIKNHIRGGVEQWVTEWHIDALQSLGFRVIEHAKINTPSMRFGQNSEKRIEYESVILFERVPL